MVAATFFLLYSILACFCIAYFYLRAFLKGESQMVRDPLSKIIMCGMLFLLCPLIAGLCVLKLVHRKINC